MISLHLPCLLRLPVISSFSYFDHKLFRAGVLGCVLNPTQQQRSLQAAPYRSHQTDPVCVHTQPPTWSSRHSLAPKKLQRTFKRQGIQVFHLHFKIGKRHIYRKQACRGYVVRFGVVPSRQPPVMGTAEQNNTSPRPIRLPLRPRTPPGARTAGGMPRCLPAPSSGAAAAPGLRLGRGFGCSRSSPKERDCLGPWHTSRRGKWRTRDLRRRDGCAEPPVASGDTASSRRPRTGPPTAACEDGAGLVPPAAPRLYPTAGAHLGHPGRKAPRTNRAR